jgi:hypothetical protein
MAKKETGKTKAAPKQKKAPLNVQDKVSKTEVTTETSKVETGAKSTIRPAAESQIIKPDKKSISFIVHGKVSSSNGYSQPGLTVKAFDRNVGANDTPLGEAMINAQGNYSITYPIEKLGEKPAADLVICMYQDGKLLQTSDVIFNAKPLETKDFVIAAVVQPEFHKLDNNALKLEARIKTLNAVVTNTDQQKIVENELQAAKGDWAAASAVLKDKLPLESMQRLHIADLMATAVGDKPEMITAILSRSDINTQRDLANLNVDKLTALITPEAKSDTDACQQAKSQAIAINKQSFVREPLTVLQRMTHEGEIPIVDEKIRSGLGTFLQRIPAETNIRITPIHKLLTQDALKDIPEEQRAEVIVQAKALWRTLAITPPDAPHVPPVLMKANLTSAFYVGEKPESTFLNTYSGAMGKETAQQVYTNAINTRIRNEHALMTIREAIRGTGLAAIDGTKTREDRSSEAKLLTEANDIQLNLDSLFADMDYCECKECQTVYSASSYFVELLNFLRNNNLDPAKDNTWSSDTKHISGTALEKLLRRRPDLADLELTCENTNTVLPYIDLVNEVMESFVVHRAAYAADTNNPKQTMLTAFNVIDETKEELLAQPQHTDYMAYCILKNEAVYPFNLPFHQPIEAARIFLKYLGTSRYELLDAFRAAHEAVRLLKDTRPFEDSYDCGIQPGVPSDVDDPLRAVQDAARKQKQEQEAAVLLAQRPSDSLLASIPEQTIKPESPDTQHGEEFLAKLHEIVLDRAVDAEFLGLTQEEYIILTKQAFWKKEYFDITQNATFTEQQYQDNIGVKPPYEYYGYATETALLDTNVDPTTGQTGLRFVKKAFLPRTGIQYTDLVELLKTRFINPLYPKGLALAILENIQASYLFLQTLVDKSSTDKEIRYKDLIDFLEKSQSWASVPQVLQAFPPARPIDAGPSKIENPIIRQWVYSCFEKLGKLIVLESGEGPQLQIEGELYNAEKQLVATLKTDGTIVDAAGKTIGNVTVRTATYQDGFAVGYGMVSSGDRAVLTNNMSVVVAGPVVLTSGKTFHEEFGSDYLVGSGEGIWLSGDYVTQNEYVVFWLSPKDTCNLDKVRLQHLDGSALCGGGSQLPIEGKLYAADNFFVGYLNKDGIIVDKSGTIIAHVTISGGVIDNNGKIFANNFPPNCVLTVIDDKGARVGWITASGLLDHHEKHPGWLPPTLDEYDRIQRFIRLWRKLGWTIDEVDKALEGLATKIIAPRTSIKKLVIPPVDFSYDKETFHQPEDLIPGLFDEVGNVNFTSDITPDFLHQLVAVKKLIEQTGLPLIKLLSFWTDISTMGEKSLYSSLFLTHNMVRNDNVFKADGKGDYLTGSAKITGHLPVLMAALNLKADDITAIINQPDALLTLQNVSEIYRNGLLAKALHIKVSDLADLKTLFSEPFADADATLALFETWGKMEDAGFTFRQLTYIIKDCDDVSKPLAPSKKTILQTVKTLYDGLNAIDSDNQDVTDVELATTELVRAKAGQVYESPVVEKILGLLEGTTVYTTNAPPNFIMLDPVPNRTAKIKYIDPKDGSDATIQVTGILTSTEKLLFPRNNEWAEAINRVYEQAQSFFNDALAGLFLDEGNDKNANEQAIEDATTNLLAGDIVVPVDQIAPGAEDPNTAPKKRLYFFQHFLPLLRQRLERRFITDTLSAAFGLPGDVTSVLLSDVLTTTEVSPRSAMAVLETIRASQPQTVKGWKGYLIPPADDNYAFVAYAPDPDKKDTAPLPLTIQGFNYPVEFKNYQTDPINVWSTDPVPLKAGMLYPLTTADCDASQLMWRTTVLPATQIPTSALLPDDTTTGTEDVFKKFCKTAILVNGFNLTADEVRYFKDHYINFDRLNFNALTLGSWRRIAGYTALRESLPKAGMPLLDLFNWACQPDGVTTLVDQLDKVTQWGMDRITALIASHHFNLQLPADFKSEVNLVKMQKAIAIADKVGVDIARLFTWAVPGSKFQLCHKNAEDIRMAMRARFDAEDWGQAVKPLNDQLREMQKQALISFLLVEPDLKAWPVVDADSLFEFFLIDVQMGAARETSRMVQAIASVQLFIKRCLMGLEDKLDDDGKQIGVSVDAIDRDRWEWMQKYRVWEANRKVFLYPENWIRPELRDDKSPFYKELESELLQKDINPQTVEEALKNYLYKVDEVANLKVVGLFIDEAGNKLHVFARTRNAPCFFFYRYFDIKESNWYPWEKMQVDIPSYDVEEVDDKGNKNGKIKENGTYLIPVVWNNRLLVFFPQFMKKTIAASPGKTVHEMSDSTSDTLKPSELWEIKLAWSEYRKGKWTQKQVSTEAIYSSIEIGNQICSYVFSPRVISNDNQSKVAIDVYNENGAVSQPLPSPEISLTSATLRITDPMIASPLAHQVPSQVSVKQVIVRYLYDSQILIAHSETYMSTPEVTLKIDIPETGKKLIERCKNFDVMLYWFSTTPVTEVLTCTAEMVWAFSDNTSIASTHNINSPLLQGFNIINFEQIEPDGPTLDNVKLDIETHMGGGQNKNNDTAYDVIIYDVNLDKYFAKLDGKGINDNNEYAEGSSHNNIVVPVTNKEITKAECQLFKAKIVQHVPPGSWPDYNHDTWGFDATITLNFKDGSSFTANKSITLKEDQAYDYLTSSDAFTPITNTSDNNTNNSNNMPHDDSIKQYFEFSGNKLSIATDGLVKQPARTDYDFHYYGLPCDLRQTITSLQVEEDGSIDTLICYEDPGPDHADMDSLLTASEQLSNCRFSYSSISNILSSLNADKLDDLFNYYSALYSSPPSAEMEYAFGSYHDEDNKSFHELKQPYSLYNWEVCFHAPMQLVEYLLKSQQFDQAIAMCHYIFNPLAKPNATRPSEDITQRCWQFPPFKEIDAKHVLENLFNDLKPGEPNTAINDWRQKPFQPHVVARDRPSAYMKYVVMKYIEILIAYGDYYFRQNSMESIPMAIQCYVMASHLYGPRGQQIPRRGKIENQTYNTLLDKWDAFGNAMVEMELAFPFTNQAYVKTTSEDVGLANVFGSMSTLFFGIPDNPNLMALRDTIEDRLLKIRSCENIEGIFQQLPLFEPPIDPALLVQAAAQGLSLSSVLNDMNSPMPNYRFNYQLQKALELCSELKSLGGAFLSAKEKGDAEALSNMRAKHESGIQNLVMEIKKQQLDEANKSLEALQQNRLGPKSRMEYYLSLIGEELSKVPDDKTDFSDLPNQLEKPVDESGLKLISYEKEEMDKAETARDLQIAVGAVETLASIMHLIPDFSLDLKYLGIGAGTTWGGINLGNAAQAIARGLQIGASELSYQSSSAARKGGFLRQLQDRIQQANAAGYEIKNIDKQILTQQIRIDIANKEITNQQQQVDNAQEVEEYLRNKYTNEELYSWMEGEIRTLYYQVYALAYDLAKKVEKTYRFERGLSESNFIQFGYWDAGRDGLLAGERLYLALKQLEAAYQEKRGYDFEITKHVSLRQIDPFALLTLRETGTCEFVLPEVLFDMDYPGHYMRRIKSVALTVPCVVGPYTTLNCTLRMTEHTFRTSPIVGSGYTRDTENPDNRFSMVNVPITSIAVSTGQNDSGVFELNFKDERYIPFEGAGAISKWRIDLPKEFYQFDYYTISDIVMHIRYTSLEGGDKLRSSASASVQNYIKSVDDLMQKEGLFAAFDLKYDFPNEWYKAIDNADPTVDLGDLTNRLPFFAMHKSVTARDAYLFMPSSLSENPTLKISGQEQPRTDGQTVNAEVKSSAWHGIDSIMDGWQLTLPRGSADSNRFWLVVRYTCSDKK